MSVVAAVAAAVAAVLLVPGARRPDVRVPWRFVGLAVLGLGVAVAVVRLGDRPRMLVLGLIGAGVVAAVVQLLRRRAVDRNARAARLRVVELCEALEAELSVGQPPADALWRAAGDWPLVEPAARTAATGGDVPAVLREVSDRPGAGDLRVLAGAWQVAHRTGHGLADAVARVAAELRAGEQTRRVVSGELASAKATARLVAGLPVLALAMGSGTGGDPWSFLLGDPVGLACLAGGLVFGLAGWTWIEAIARDVDRGR